MEKRTAIIVDMDGTLADLNGRLPYGEAQADCEQDLVRAEVKGMVEAYAEQGLTIIILSGRFRRYEDHTARWLEAHNIPWNELMLRADDDLRSDDIIKREMYEDYIEPFNNVIAVIDDRSNVIRMWRSLGLNVIDVGDGTEF